MATRYWVGGAGTWNASSTTNWSTTSGGAGGASAPTNADDVIIDTSSGTGAISCSAGVCQNLTVTATQAISVGNPANPWYLESLSVFGALSVVSGGSFTFNTTNLGSVWTITFASNNTTKSFVTGGKALPGCSFKGGSDVYNMGDDITNVRRLNLDGGTFNTNNYNMTGGFYLSGGAMNVGSSTITLFANGFWVNVGAALNMGTSTITGGDNTYIQGRSNGGDVYNNIVFTGDNCGITYNITCLNLTVNKFLRFFKTAFTTTPSLTVTGTFTANGNNPFRINISGCGTTITAATVSMSYVNFWKVTGAGAGSWTGTSIGDMGGNSGITFDTAKTVYAVSGGSPNWGDDIWSTSSGGAVSLTNFPLPQDTAVIDNSSCASGGQVAFLGINKTGTYSNVNYSNRTNPINLIPGGITSGGDTTGSFTGALILSSAVTVGNWAGFEFSGNFSLNSAGVSIPNALVNFSNYVDSQATLAANCTFTGGVLYNYSVYFSAGIFPTLNLNGYTFNATQGIECYSTQSTIYLVGPGTISSTLANPVAGNGIFYFITSTATGSPILTSTGAGTRSIRTPNGDASLNVSNSGSVTLVASGNIKNVDFTGFTGTLNNLTNINIGGNLTIGSGGTYTGGTSVMTFTGLYSTSSTSTITTAGKTFDWPITFNGAAQNFVFADALTQGSTRAFTITNGTVKFQASTTNTVGSFLTSGTNTKYLASTVSGTQATVTQASGAVSVNYLAIKDSAATGGATWNASYARSNINQGNNTGWFFSSNTGSFFFLIG